MTNKTPSADLADVYAGKSAEDIATEVGAKELVEICCEQKASI